MSKQANASLRKKFFAPFTNWRIGAKMVIGFGVVLVIAAAMGFASLNSMSKLSGLTSFLYTHPLTVTKVLYEAKVEVAAIQNNILNTLLMTENTNVDRITGEIAQSERIIADRLAAAKEKFLGDKWEFTATERSLAEWKPIYAEIIALADAGKKKDALELVDVKGASQIAVVNQRMDMLLDFSTKKAVAVMENANATNRWISFVTIALLVGTILLSVAVAYLTTRAIAVPLRKLNAAMLDLAQGRNDVEVVGTERGDEIGEMARAVVVFRDAAIEKLRLETIKATADQINLRVRSALDVSTTNMMIGDENYNIVYMNRTMQAMMREAEAELRKEIPTFDSSRLIGASMDLFHKNPAHQRRLLDTLTDSHGVHIKIGSLKFHLHATPVIDENDRRVGTVMEWKNETVEKAIEEEVNGLVNAAVAGDLTQRVPLEGKHGFMLNFAKSMNTLCSNVADTMAEIKAAASEVANAAAEISASTTDLSQRTEEQAASLEETSAAMEEISATVKKNAENAQQANQFTAGTREVADRGGKVVNEAVHAMSRIEESSRKIADIIGVIDEIARQTNLLALNAAVEAARAGEAGRGFAVVASEVRSLAQRSSQAAKDIKDLILNSSNQVHEGVELVNRAGTSLNEILESIKRVSDIVSDIANASVEQAAGLEQINKALTQMDEVTQQNSALVEQNAATAKTLEHQSMAMDERISFFQLDNVTPITEAHYAGHAAQKQLAASAPQRTMSAKEPAVAQRRPAPVVKRGPVGKMRAAIATAFQDDPEWKEF